LGGNGKEGTNVKDDLDDITMAYVLYVVLAIVTGAAIVVVKML